MVLTHRAGLPGIRTPLPDGAIYDWDRLTAALAAETPWWPPGTAVGYHVNTFGVLVGEVVRRITGDTIGRVFRREIAGPLGADAFFGMGPELDPRIADYVFSAELFASHPVGTADDDPERRAAFRAVYMNPPGFSGLGIANDRAWRAAELPSANGHASARAIAAFYVPLTAGGGSLLAAETLAAARVEASAGHDVVLDRPSRFGLGFQLNGAERRFGPGARTFGHFGAGGSVGFADPEAGLAFGYAMNRAGPRWQNPRNRALIDAVYASL
jgi:CubicO group peptidase (beta-lactamase class C family)